MYISISYKIMSKYKYLHDNSYVNLVLKGFTSIITGFCIWGGAYLIKGVLNGFLIDDSPLGMLSLEIIEIFLLGILLFVFIFSNITIIIAGRKVAKKDRFKLWNTKTKNIAFKYLLILTLIFIILNLLINAGLINYLTPALLIQYGLLLYLLKNKGRKQILIISGLAVFLALICFLIPSYWYSSVSILGIAHIAYGVVVK